MDDTSPESRPAESADKPAGLSLEKLRVFWGRIGATGPLALLAGTLPALGGFLLLGLLSVVGPWLSAHAAIGLPLYIAGFTATAGLALLPTYAQAVLGGWAFGLAGGLVAALTGFCGAALLGYGVAWRASGDRIVTLIASNPKWNAVRQTLIDSGFWKTLLVVTLVRLPSSPFALTNLVMAATRVRLTPFLLGTLLGMTPRTLAAVYIGAHMSELDFSQARNVWLLVAGIVGILVVLGVLNQLANAAIARVTGANGPASARS